MAEEALQGTIPGPAAVAVHDDSHMFGQALRFQRRIYGALFRCELMNAQRAWRIQMTCLLLRIQRVRLPVFGGRLFCPSFPKLGPRRSFRPAANGVNQTEGLKSLSTLA